MRDGNLLAAAQEERFTRKKHDPRFPTNALAYCLDEAGISIRSVLNLKSKHREPFRPFAPSVLEEKASVIRLSNVQT